MKKTLILSLLACTLWLGCDKQDQTSQAPDTHYLVDELYTWDFTVQDGITALLDEVGVDPNSETVVKIMDLLKNTVSHRLRAVAISYRTVDPDGNDVVSAGAFIYPLDSKYKGVVEVPPIANMDYFHAPSLFVRDHKLYEEATPSILGYITINPDLIGGNLTGTTHLRPFLHIDNTGIVSYHMRCAVSEYLYQKEGYTLPKETSVMGYSLGGSSALAIAKYYQENAPEIKVTQVFTGGGVYDPITAFRDYAVWGECIYPAIPALIYSMDTYYRLGLDYNQIFTGGLQNSVNSPNPEEGGDGYAYWYDNTHTSMRIADRWGANLHTYLHPDFFNTQMVGEFAKLIPCLEENSIVYRYVPDPNIQIKLMHANEDNLIPKSCSDLLYSVYKHKGADISYMDMNGDHYDGGANFMVTIMLYLLLK